MPNGREPTAHAPVGSECAPEAAGAVGFSPTELAAIAHVYRAEVYRSTSWRARLDTTTNWAVVTTGIAVSLAYADPTASALPLVLVGLLVGVFLVFEARRYRYFNVWRARCRLMEMDLWAPLLRGEGAAMNGDWNVLLAADYAHPRFHISYARAIGRRLRKNYAYILLGQAVAYYGKLAIHPTPLESVDALFSRAAVGPIPGEAVIFAGLMFHAGWLILALVTLHIERRYRRTRRLIGIA